MILEHPMLHCQIMTKQQIDASYKPNRNQNIEAAKNADERINKDDIAYYYTNSENDLQLIEVTSMHSSKTAKTVSIKEGAELFTSYNKPKVRKNILECVSGFDLDVELNFIRYLIYNNLNEHLYKFLCPNPVDFINENDIISEDKDFFARHEENEDQDEGWQKVPRKPKKHKERKSCRGDDQVQGQVEKENDEKDEEGKSNGRIKRDKRKDKESKKSKDSERKNEHHRTIGARRTVDDRRGRLDEKRIPPP